VFPLDIREDVRFPFPLTRSGGSGRTHSKSAVSGLAHSSSSVHACLGRKSSCLLLPSRSPLPSTEDPQKLWLAPTFLGSIVRECGAICWRDPRFLGLVFVLPPPPPRFLGLVARFLGLAAWFLGLVSPPPPPPRPSQPSWPSTGRWKVKNRLLDFASRDDTTGALVRGRRNGPVSLSRLW